MILQIQPLMVTRKNVDEVSRMTGWGYASYLEQRVAGLEEKVGEILVLVNMLIHLENERSKV